MKRSERKSFSLNEVFDDKMEEYLLSEQDRADSFFYDDINYDDDLWAGEYFAEKNIDLVHSFHQHYKIFKSDINRIPYEFFGNEIFFKIKFSDLNQDSIHPLIRLLLDNFHFLNTDDYFNLFFCYSNKWNDRTEPSLDIFLIREVKWIRSYNSRIDIECILEIDYESEIDTVYKKVAYKEVSSFPSKYQHFGITKAELIQNFSVYSQLQSMVEY